MRLVLLALTALLASCADAAPQVQASNVFHDDLTFSGIPAEWVREGKPVARTKFLAHAHGEGVTTALWDCTAGKFEWYFATDEVVHILEGEVAVGDGKGGTRTLKPGDVAYFPAGMKSLWHVPKYVKKLAVLGDNSEPFTRKVSRKLGELFASK